MVRVACPDPNAGFPKGYALWWEFEGKALIGHVVASYAPAFPATFSAKA